MQRRRQSRKRNNRKNRGRRSRWTENYNSKQNKTKIKMKWRRSRKKNNRKKIEEDEAEEENKNKNKKKRTKQESQPRGRGRGRGRRRGGRPRPPSPWTGRPRLTRRSSSLVGHKGHIVMAFLLRFLCCPCFSLCVCVVRHPGEWVFARLTSVSGLWRVDSEALSRARTPVEVCLGSGVVCFFLFEF